MNQNKLPLYELTIENEEIDEVYALSLVSAPAIEADWVFFSKDGNKEEIKFATIDSDKKLIVAPVLIPEKRILRIDQNSNEEYNVFFTAETVEKLAQNYLKKGYQDRATIEHGKNIDGKVTVVESWISKSQTKDKSALYFNRTFPVGTWFVTFKVNDENLWQNYVKTGIVKAVSLEGIFDHQLVKQSKVESVMFKDIKDLTNEEAAIVLLRIAELFENPSVASTYPGESAEGKKKYKAPSLLVEGDMCPEATQNIKINIENRQNAIDTANYGPLNPNEPNEDYWKAKADQFKGDVETAKKSLCGNCSFFIQTKQMLDCIAGGIGGDVKNEWDTINAGTLGFCSAFDYKCSSERTCDIWLVGGPITD
jgi:hypothetical protein